MQGAGPGEGVPSPRGRGRRAGARERGDRAGGGGDASSKPKRSGRRERVPGARVPGVGFPALEDPGCGEWEWRGRTRGSAGPGFLGVAHVEPSTRRRPQTLIHLDERGDLHRRHHLARNLHAGSTIRGGRCRAGQAADA